MGCKESKINFFVYTDEGTQIAANKVNSIRANENILNGEWSLYDSNKKLLYQGQFDKGLINGTWVYDFPAFDTALSWDYIRKAHIEFSYPDGWKIYNKDELIFGIYEKGIDKRKEGAMIGMIEHKNNSPDSVFIGLTNSFINDSTYKIINSHLYESIYNNHKYYFANLKMKQKENEFNYLLMVTKLQNYVLEYFFISTLDKPTNELIFNEVLFTVKLYNNDIFSRFEKSPL